MSLTHSLFKCAYLLTCPFRYIKIGDKEVEYHPSFHLILHTKLANPHYKPEMQAQASLINFTVTRDGLEDQLLAEVVATERPDLEEQKVHMHALIYKPYALSLLVAFVSTLRYGYLVSVCSCRNSSLSNKTTLRSSSRNWRTICYTVFHQLKVIS